MKKIKLSDGKTYKVTENENHYPTTIPDEVISIIENLIHTGIKVKLIYGDVKTGRSWNEEHDNTGTLGRTTGKHCPILLTNYNSTGGGITLTDSILQIRYAGKNGRILYQHQKYHPSTVVIVPGDMPEYRFNTMVNGELYGRHTSLKSAQICKSKIL